MNKRTKDTILNWVMLISLIIVFSSGILVKAFPGMWLGIIHALSGLVLFVSALIHAIQHMRRKD